MPFCLSDGPVLVDDFGFEPKTPRRGGFTIRRAKRHAPVHHTGQRAEDSNPHPFEPPVFEP